MFYSFVFKSADPDFEESRCRVCDAFNNAKEFIAKNEDIAIQKESRKFKIHKQPGACDTENQLQFDQGSLKIQKPQEFKPTCDRISPLIGRQQDMHGVISEVIKNRLVMVVGVPGVGKSAVC